MVGGVVDFTLCLSPLITLWKPGEQVSLAYLRNESQTRYQHHNAHYKDH